MNPRRLLQLAALPLLAVLVLPLSSQAAFVPTDLPDTALWLDASDINGDGLPDAIANGAPVTTWKDRSGLGRDAGSALGTPTYVASSPTANNAPVVHFSTAGGADQLSTTYNFNGLGADYTIFGVSRYSGGANARVITSKTQNWLFGHWSSGDERWYANGWIRQAGNANTNLHLYTGTIGPAVNGNAGDPGADFWKDGVWLTANHQGSSNTAYKPGGLALGAWTGGGEASNADVAEVIIYDRHLDPIERNQVGAYLQDKYGIAGTYNDAIKSATVGSFTGGDPGEGLDMQGDFLYAVNVRGPAAGMIGDANFTVDTVAGVTVTATNNILDWGNPSYGGTTNDNNLELVMESIRWSSNKILDVDLSLAGQRDGYLYNLQLLFAEGCCGRGFDVFVEDVMVAEDFSPALITGSQALGSTGAVVSVMLQGWDDEINVRLSGINSLFGDTNPILQGVTLELVAVPEPTTLLIWSLLAGLGVGLGWRRRK